MNKVKWGSTKNRQTQSINQPKLRGVKIAIASDHAGFRLKEGVRRHLQKLGHEVKDLGTFDEKPVDYPDFAFPVAKSVASGDCEMGILFCGTGIGMSIAANKVKGIRAAHCTNVEEAKLSRQHNNANVLCLGGRILGKEQAFEMVDAWLTTEFEGGRHERRLGKIENDKNP
jgi:ribose 5-phosphate isomerase B